MKNVKTYENFKKLIGGSKLVFAGAGLGATILMTGCSGCSVQPEPSSSEVTVDLPSETPSDIEIIETSEEPSEEVVVEETSVLEELPLTNDDGSVYYAVITEEQLQAKIDEICNMATSDYERDCMISTLIALNADSMNYEVIDKYDIAYCRNLNSYDLNYIIMEWNYGKEELPLSFYFIDEKTAAAVDKFEKMMENKEYDVEDAKAAYLDMMAKKYGGSSLGVEGIPMGNLYEYCFYYSGIIPYSEGYGSLHSGTNATQTGFAYFDVEPTPIDEYVSSHQDKE